MKRIIVCSVFIGLLSIFTPVKAQVFIDLESGLVATGYNDVRIPNDGGTLFSLKHDIKSENEWFYRLRGGFILHKRHVISFLYAPLTVKSAGLLPETIQFEGTLFTAGIPVNARYKFNSYRATYRYDFVKTSHTDFGLGLTAKIRDAKISLNSQTFSAEKDNVGLVPLINFRLYYHTATGMGFLLEGDALAAPQGRAEDVLAALTFNLSRKITWKLGYRILEGGADTESIYSFALFHYASTGFIINL
jgi:hypothetical protein